MCKFRTAEAILSHLLEISSPSNADMPSDCRPCTEESFERTSNMNALTDLAQTYRVLLRDCAYSIRDDKESELTSQLSKSCARQPLDLLWMRHSSRLYRCSPGPRSGCVPTTIQYPVARSPALTSRGGGERVCVWGGRGCFAGGALQGPIEKSQ